MNPQAGPKTNVENKMPVRKRKGQMTIKYRIRQRKQKGNLIFFFFTGKPSLLESTEGLAR